MRRAALAAAAAGLLLGAAAGAARGDVFRMFAFGDSITVADPLFDDSDPYLGGYPGRLNILYGCTPSTCIVVNEGAPGERTSQGVTRIVQVLAQGPWHAALIMEGTNDVFRNPPISNATIQFNLGVMANSAEAQGVEAVLASIMWFHPDGTRGNSRDAQITGLRNLIAGLASAEDRVYVDVWGTLCPPGADVHGHTQQQCFNLHYFQGVPDPDPVGHPNAGGYDMMADEFFEKMTAAPAPGPPTPVSPLGLTNNPTPALVWDRESPEVAKWYRVILDGPGGNIVDNLYKAQDRCSGSSCTATPPIFLEDGDYAWRVRGRNTSGFGVFSADALFTVDSNLIFADGFESGDLAAWGSTVP